LFLFQVGILLIHLLHKPFMVGVGWVFIQVRIYRPFHFDYPNDRPHAGDGVMIAIGGIPDHVHILARVHQQTALSDLMRVLKSRSSGWVHDTFPDRQSFAWQSGYGAFTVSYSQLDKVEAYIQNQEEHHRVKSFQDEFREFLRAHGLEPDEEHMWE
jgi:hypothetical protein